MGSSTVEWIGHMAAWSPNEFAQLSIHVHRCILHSSSYIGQLDLGLSTAQDVPSSVHAKRVHVPATKQTKTWETSRDR